MNKLKKFIASKSLLKEIHKTIQLENYSHLPLLFMQFIVISNTSAILDLQEELLKSKKPTPCLIFAIEYPHADMKRIEEICINYADANVLLSYIESFDVIYNVKTLCDKAIALKSPDLCFTLLKTDLNTPTKELLKIVLKQGSIEHIFKLFYLSKLNIYHDVILDAFLSNKPHIEHIRKYINLIPSPNIQKIEYNLIKNKQYQTYLLLQRDPLGLTKDEIITKVIEVSNPELNLSFASLFKKELTVDEIDKLIEPIVDYGNFQLTTTALKILNNKLTDKQKELLEFASSAFKHNKNEQVHNYMHEHIF